jgi:hypothetical protein
VARALIVAASSNHPFGLKLAENPVKLGSLKINRPPNLFLRGATPVKRIYPLNSFNDCGFCNRPPAGIGGLGLHGTAYGGGALNGLDLDNRRVHAAREHSRRGFRDSVPSACQIELSVNRSRAKV